MEDDMAMTIAIRVALGVACVIVSGGPAAAQACRAPRVPVDTVLSMKYCSDPAFDPVIDGQIQKIRQEVRAARQAGRLIIYMSTPISPRGGGIEKINIEIAAAIRARIEKTYGGGAWVLDPGVYQMPNVGTKPPGGGEYMVMFTRLLAGDDGAGRDFDMVHFTGPGDMRAFFGCGSDDLAGCLGRWLVTRGATDADVRRVAAGEDTRRAFIRYYAMRASAAYSAGAHDEWNIFVRINRKRALGDQIAMYFDGRQISPAEMETEISPGYEVR
jgi:hypothetical protein